MFGKAAVSGILAMGLSGGMLSLLILPPDREPLVGKTSYMPVDLTEPFPALRDRLAAGKAEVMARQKALLEARYDLGDRPAGGVAMSGGKPVQATLATHWARLVELMYAAERAHALATDPDIIDLVQRPIGILERKATRDRVLGKIIDYVSTFIRGVAA